MSLFWLLLAAVLNGVIGTSTVYLPTLPMEAHSFNDLPVWDQLLKARIQYFKLDVGVCSETSCEDFSTFGRTDLPGYRGSKSDCFTHGSLTTYCCMCLRGDVSTRPYVLDPFNTTWDLIAYLNSSNPLFPLRSSPYPLRIGLDYGALSDCDGFVSSPLCPAVPMMVDFLLNLSSVIESNNLAISPYFDAGLNGWFSDLDSYCLSNTCNEWQLALHNLNWGSEDSPPLPADQNNTGNYRYTVANDQWQDLLGDCQAGPSFWIQGNSNARLGTQPYLWYETQHQYENLNIFETWSQCYANNSGPLDHQSPNTGMMIVSNVDPSMFEVYSSSAINRGANVAFTSELPNSAPMKNASAGEVLVLDSQDPSTDRWVLLAAQTPLGVVVSCMPYSDAAVGVMPNVSLAVSTLTVPFEGILSSFSAARTPDPTPNTQIIVLSSYLAEYTSLIFDPASGTLSTFRNEGVVVQQVGGNEWTFLGANAVCWALGDPSQCVLVAALVPNSPTSDNNIPNGYYLNISVCSLTANSSLSSFSVQTDFFTNAGASIGFDASSMIVNQSNLSVEGLLIYSATGLSTQNQTDVHTNLMREDVLHLMKQDIRNSESNYLRKKIANTLQFDIDESGILRSPYGATKEQCKKTFSQEYNPHQSQKARLNLDDLCEFLMKPSHDNLEKLRLSSGFYERGILSSKNYIPVNGQRAILFGNTILLEVGNFSSVPSISVTLRSQTGTTHPARIGFGSNPKLSIGPTPHVFNSTDSIALLSVIDGMCSDGLALNNMDFSRCMLTNPSEDGNFFYKEIQSVPYLMNYHYGSVSSWNNLIQGPASASGAQFNPQTALGPCNNNIIYGKVTGVAANSGISHFVQSVSSPVGVQVNGSEIFGSPVPEVGTLAVHSADIPGSVPWQTQTMCGNADPSSGLMWDQWRLPLLL